MHWKCLIELLQTGIIGFFINWWSGINVFSICRLRLHEEKQLLLQQLKEALRSMTQLESQLKTLSASTLSVSSSSSLGSLSTTSSKGSLSSGLSFTDIYGGPQCLAPATYDRPVDMADLHKRLVHCNYFFLNYVNISLLLCIKTELRDFCGMICNHQLMKT